MESLENKIDVLHREQQEILRRLAFLSTQVCELMTVASGGSAPCMWTQASAIPPRLATSVPGVHGATSASVARAPEATWGAAYGSRPHHDASTASHGCAFSPQLPAEPCTHGRTSAQHQQWFSPLAVGRPASMSQQQHMGTTHSAVAAGCPVTEGVQFMGRDQESDGSEFPEGTVRFATNLPTVPARSARQLPPLEISPDSILDPERGQSPIMRAAALEPNISSTDLMANEPDRDSMRFPDPPKVGILKNPGPAPPTRFTDVAERVINDNSRRNPSRGNVLSRGFKRLTTFSRKKVGPEEDAGGGRSGSHDLQGRLQHTINLDALDFDDDADLLSPSRAICSTWLSTSLRKFFTGILYPSERQVWDIIVLITSVWVLLVTPPTVGFGMNGLYFYGNLLGYLELGIDWVYIADIYVNARTVWDTTSSTHVQWTRRRLIASYLYSTRFLFDASVLPAFVADWILWRQYARVFKYHGFKQTYAWLAGVRLLKVVKVANQLRFGDAVGVIEKKFGQGWSRSSYLILLVLLSCHFGACFLYFTAYVNHLGPTTWIYRYYKTLANIQDSDDVEQIFQQSGILRRYLDSLYWVVVTITSVGYGEIWPATAFEKVAIMIATVIGVTLFAYLGGSITTLLTAQNSSKAQVIAMTTQLLDFLHHHRIPPTLSSKIVEFVARRHEREIVEEQHFIKKLPTSLRIELKEQLFKGLIETVPFFQDTGKMFRIEVVEELVAEYIAQGEVLIDQGEICTSIKLLAEGRCEVWHNSSMDSTQEGQNSEENPPAQQTEDEEQPVGGRARILFRRPSQKADDEQGGPVELGYIKAGCYFNAYSCLMETHCPAAVVADSFTHVYHLHYKKLDRLYNKYPQELDKFRKRVTHTQVEDSPTAASPKVPADERQTEDSEAQPEATQTLRGTIMRQWQGQEQQRDSGEEGSSVGIPIVAAAVEHLHEEGDRVSDQGDSDSKAALFGAGAALDAEESNPASRLYSGLSASQRWRRAGHRVMADLAAKSRTVRYATDRSQQNQPSKNGQTRFESLVRELIYASRGGYDLGIGVATLNRTQDGNSTAPRSLKKQTARKYNLAQIVRTVRQDFPSLVLATDMAIKLNKPDPGGWSSAFAGRLRSFTGHRQLRL